MADAKNAINAKNGEKTISTQALIDVFKEGRELHMEGQERKPSQSRVALSGYMLHLQRKFRPKLKPKGSQKNGF